jgi:hypothetical protein
LLARLQAKANGQGQGFQVNGADNHVRAPVGHNYTVFPHYESR